MGAAAAEAANDDLDLISVNSVILSFNSGGWHGHGGHGRQDLQGEGLLLDLARLTHVADRGDGPKAVALSAVGQEGGQEGGRLQRWGRRRGRGGGGGGRAEPVATRNCVNRRVKGERRGR